MSSELPQDLRRELRHVLADLRVTHLAGTAWPVVAGDLGRLARAVDQGDEDAVRKALVPIAQAGREGKVRGRLAGANRAAAYVASTRPTRWLPVVGAVVGVLAVVVAYLLGDLVVAAGTAVVALVVAGLVYAGTRSGREHLEQRHAQAFSPTKERTEPAPSVVVEAIDKIEASLTTTS